MSRIWNDEQLIEAVKGAITYKEILIKIGLRPTGGNYKQIQKHIKRLNIDVSHVLGRRHNLGQTRNIKYQTKLEDILIENCQKYIHISTFKKRLIKLGLLKNECYICGLIEWLDKPMSLHLDHINGNHYDNRIENLRILCPNCHSQTDTYCGKNNKKHYDNNCINCGKKINKLSKYCHKCHSESRYKINWPTNEKLLEMVEHNGISATGRILGVSRTTVSKRIRRIKKWG